MIIVKNSLNIKVWSSILIILFFIFQCTDSPKSDSIAKIGDIYISTYEFKNVAQFNPYLSSIDDIASAKKIY